MTQDVVIRSKPTPQLDVEIDMAQLTWRDVRRIEELSQNTEDGSANDALEAIIAKCTGMDPGDLPAYAVKPIITAIMQKVQGTDGTAKN